MTVKGYLRSLLIALAGITALAAVAFQYFPVRQVHVSDDELIAGLHRNQERYRYLVSLFRFDAPLQVVSPTWLYPNGQISTERWLQYRKLFSELDLEGGMRSLRGETLWFIARVQRDGAHGSSKGLMYRPLHPEPLLPSLDQVVVEPGRSWSGYRRIDSDWYVYLQVE